jgi:hypothetical protein
MAKWFTAPQSSEFISVISRCRPRFDGSLVGRHKAKMSALSKVGMSVPPGRPAIVRRSFMVMVETAESRQVFVNTNTGYFGLEIRRGLSHDKELRHWIRCTTLDCSHMGVTRVKLKPNPAPTRSELDQDLLPEKKLGRRS